jgi:5,10-methenyltetrahydromethanopterin hydrogenase
MNEARKIIIKSMIDHPNNWKKAADTALKQLRELVEGRKKELPRVPDGIIYTPAEKMERAIIMSHNRACDDIADMIYKEEK